MAKLILTLLLLLPGCAFAQAPPDLKLFADINAQFITGLKANYADAIEKLNSENFTGTCQDHQRELNSLKTADLERRSRQADLSIAVDLYQDSNKPQIYSDMMLPSLDIELAEFNLKICQIHQSPQMDHVRESSRRSDKLFCYRDAQLQLNRTKIEWEVIDGRYPDLPEQAYIEKMRSYTSNVPAEICE